MRRTKIVVQREKRMPILCVKNWPSESATFVSKCTADVIAGAVWRDNAFKRRFGKVLREATATAGVNGLNSVNQVTVSFDTGASQQDDTTIVIVVEGLFTHPRRTLDQRRKLAESLRDAVNQQIGADVKMIEVFVTTFDPNHDGFADTKTEEY